MVTRSPSLRPPLLLALFIVATAPFMGTLRDLLLALFGRRFVMALAAGFAVVVAGLVAAAALRVREPRRATRLLRLGGLALALLLLGVQVVGFGTGNLQVDAVERRRSAPSSRRTPRTACPRRSAARSTPSARAPTPSPTRARCCESGWRSCRGWISG